jgi:shikimate dehydrogenase
MTDRYAVIGHPVAHSKSPWIHAEFARACGHDMEYTRVEAPLDGFAREVEAFRAAGGKGMNVTLPFKEAAYDYCGHLSERARRARVVNTLSFAAQTRGDTTDGIGLVTDLRNQAVQLAGRRVLLMGAGGAAQGVAGALLEAGVSALVVANRTVTRAQALTERFPGLRACGYAELGHDRFDVIINATSAGLQDEAAALPPGVLYEGMFAYDMVYGRDTPFLAAARTAGARTSDGLGMLVEQAAESFFIWRGVRPETAPVLARLRAA